MNTRNYSQRSNFTCGSEALELLPFYVQTINIPGVSFSLPELSGRGGVKLNMSGDSVTFNSLSTEIILDEDYMIYKEINDIIFKHINLETGTYADFSFDFWMEMTDDMGKSIMKVEYYNCRIESLGDLSLDATDDTTEQTFSLDLKYDWHKVIYNNIPALRV